MHRRVLVILQLSIWNLRLALRRRKKRKKKSNSLFIRGAKITVVFQSTWKNSDSGGQRFSLNWKMIVFEFSWATNPGKMTTTQNAAQSRSSYGCLGNEIQKIKENSRVLFESFPISAIPQESCDFENTSFPNLGHLCRFKNRVCFLFWFSYDIQN